MKKHPSVLVITPGYPSEENLYTCAFVHARVKAYLAHGLDVTVCVSSKWSRPDTMYRYEIDGVRVSVCGIKGLRELLREHEAFDVIVAHFADELVLNVLERESNRSRIVVVFHGADILCERFSCNFGRPYFERTKPEWQEAGEWVARKEFYRRLSQNPKFSWIFVSEYLKDAGERFLGVRFVNSYVIGNLIDENLFIYREKSKEDRKKIYFCRRFDNEKVYCIDTVVLAICRLALKPYFAELEFHIYGDGNDYERLTAPIRNLQNVHFHRHFLLNSKMPEVYAQYGVGLFPSRFDSQAVAISEAAASGLVVIGGDIPAVASTYPQKEFGMLVNPDNPDDIVDRIDFLYRNPEAFVNLSKKMSERARRFSSEKTIKQECALIEKLAGMQEENLSVATNGAGPLLSLIVPAYNMEKYLDVCLSSLLNHDQMAKIEVMVVNDGSSDNTLRIARAYQDRYPSVVHVIDKKNGGHGSCINMALKEIRGKYVRVIDSDDWVVSDNLGRMVSRLEHEEADCVLTYARYDYVEDGTTANVIAYDNLIDGQKRTFEELMFAGYDFRSYGPILHTASWKRDVLIQSNVNLPEGISYDDMLWNVLPLRRAESVILYDLDIYRYTMGRPGQTVSREYVRKHSKDHNQVFEEVSEFCEKDSVLSAAKRYYIQNHIIGELGCNNIYVLYQADGIEKVEAFLNLLESMPEVLRSVITFSIHQGGDTKQILLSMDHGRRLVHRILGSHILPVKSTKSRYIPARGSLFHRVRSFCEWVDASGSLKKAIKASLPYGIVRMWQKRIYKM